MDACILRDFFCRAVGCRKEMATPRTSGLFLECPARMPDTPDPVMAGSSRRTVETGSLGNGTYCWQTTRAGAIGRNSRECHVRPFANSRLYCDVLFDAAAGSI